MEAAITEIAIGIDGNALTIMGTIANATGVMTAATAATTAITGITAMDTAAGIGNLPRGVITDTIDTIGPGGNQNEE